MVAVKPSQIREIDAYAEEKLNLPTAILMQRAGEAVFRAVQTKLHKKNPLVLVLCGGGNNGGDGYVAARLMVEHGMCVCAVDLFSVGQRSQAGKAALEAYLATPYARILYGIADVEKELAKADCVVEAVYGVGARADLPEEVLFILRTLHKEREKRAASGKKMLSVSVDCPIGVDSESGTAHEEAFEFDVTVELSFPKIGTHSYPAARYAGEFFYDSLGLPMKQIIDNFNLQDIVMDGESAKGMLPFRDPEGHKGSFGTLGMLAGSRLYRGAALLSAESALRGGVGLLRYFGEDEVCDALLLRTPEAVCHRMGAIADMSEADAERFVADAPKTTAFLIGSGCGQSQGLAFLLRAFLQSEGAPLILDADALNVLAERQYGLLAFLIQSKRKVLLTPHPLEFARLIGQSVDEVQANRLPLAREFAVKYGVTLLLKGKGTVAVDQNGRIAVNTSGNTALSKGGSGDVLAGLCASYAAQGLPLFDAASLGAYLHGKAAETLSEILGEAGVLPSDLPMAIAKEQNQ